MEPEDRWTRDYKADAGMVDNLIQFMWFGGGLAAAIIGVGIVTPMFTGGSLIHNLQVSITAQPFLLTALQLASYAFMLILGLLWAKNGTQELRLLQRWLKPMVFAPKRRNEPFLWCVGIGILLGVLIVVVQDFRVMISSFAIYTVADIWLWRLRQDELAKIIGETRSVFAHDYDRVVNRESSHNRRKVLQTMETFGEAIKVIGNYYLNKPHIRRLLIQLAICAVLLVLYCSDYVVDLLPSSFRRYAPDSAVLLSNIGLMIGYVTFLVSAGWCERVIDHWRADMDRDLAILDGRLSAIESG